MIQFFTLLCLNFLAAFRKRIVLSFKENDDIKKDKRWAWYSTGHETFTTTSHPDAQPAAASFSFIPNSKNNHTPAFMNTLLRKSKFVSLVIASFLLISVGIAQTNHTTITISTSATTPGCGFIGTAPDRTFAMTPGLNAAKYSSFNFKY